MSSQHHRSRASSVSSILSFATTPDLSGMSSTSSAHPQEPRGVGLSDPIQSAYRRKILGIIDRMRATGWVISGMPPAATILISVQGGGGHGFADDCRDWLAKRRQIFTNRIYIWNHPPSSGRYLHQVNLIQLFRPFLFLLWGKVPHGVPPLIF